MGKDELKTYVQRYIQLTEEEFEFFYEKISYKRYAKKEFVFREGDICQSYYFIVSGLVRQFFIDSNSNEQIQQFGIEYWWVTDMEGLVTNQPSRFFMQCIEPTEVLILRKQDLEVLYDQIPQLQTLFRIISERMLVAIQRRYTYFLRLEGVDRYQTIATNLPQLIQRVPQYMIASYLNLTPEYLSALRKNK